MVRDKGDERKEEMKRRDEERKKERKMIARYTTLWSPCTLKSIISWWCT